VSRVSKEVRRRTGAGRGGKAGRTVLERGGWELTLAGARGRSSEDRG
jgi:hypothetical protein